MPSTAVQDASQRVQAGRRASEVCSVSPQALSELVSLNTVAPEPEHAQGDSLNTAEDTHELT